MTKLYLIGSLRNSRIPIIAQELRAAGFSVFDDWFAAGPEADDWWQRYEAGRGHSYAEALKGLAAEHVFRFDRTHLACADVVVLVTPCGKSGHLELGWSLGQGKQGYILLDAPVERFDVMYKFANGVVESVPELIEELTT